MKNLLFLIIALAPVGLWAQAVQCPLGGVMLRGTYVVTTTGTAGSPVWAPFTGPVATLAVMVFDGSGGLQIPTVTIVAANPPLNVTPPATITGSYTINRDCTGSMTLNFAPQPNGHYNLVISPDGRQLTAIASDRGDVLISTGTRM